MKVIERIDVDSLFLLRIITILVRENFDGLYIFFLPCVESTGYKQTAWHSFDFSPANSMYNRSTEISQLPRRQQKLHCYFILHVLNVAELFSNMYNIYNNFKDIIQYSE